MSACLASYDTPAHPSLLPQISQTPRLRKRTKTGCLTCRKRRIKCGEERPTCRNCIHSKRHCEGFAQRVIFRAPMAQWPVNEVTQSTLACHSDLLADIKQFNRQFTPASVLSLDETATGSWEPYVWIGKIRDKPERRGHIQNALIEEFSESSGSLKPGTYTPAPTVIVDANDLLREAAVEFEDEGYYDLELDDDIERIPAVSEVEDVPTRHDNHNFYNGALVRYQASFHTSPLQNEFTARIFEHFISSIGPALGVFDRREDKSPTTPYAQRSLWTYELPLMALDNLGLLHAMLALSSLQIAKLQGASVTSSLKHYSFALKRLHRAVGDDKKRREVATLAITLLLACYELMAADFPKLRMHFEGAKQLLSEVDFSAITKEDMQARTSGANKSHVHSGHSAPKLSGTGGSKDAQLYQDLWWWFARQDACQAILSNNRLIMDCSRWDNCPPRVRTGDDHSVCGTHDHIVLLLSRIVNFAARDMERKLGKNKAIGASWRPPKGGHFKGLGTVRGQPPPGVSEPLLQDQDVDPDLATAIQEWFTLKLALDNFISQLPPHSGPVDAAFVIPMEHCCHSPFGVPIFFQELDIAILNALCHMCRIRLYRAHPEMPPGHMFAAGVARGFTAEAVQKICQIAAGVFSVAHKSSPTTFHKQMLQTQPECRDSFASGVLFEMTRPLFVAGIQLVDLEQRTWLIKYLHSIEISTGWDTGASGCQIAWQRLYELGRGPPWNYDTYWPQCDTNPVTGFRPASTDLKNEKVLPQRESPEVLSSEGRQDLLDLLTKKSKSIELEQPREQTPPVAELSNQQPEHSSATDTIATPLSSSTTRNAPYEGPRSLNLRRSSSTSLDGSYATSSSSDCPSTDVESQSIRSRKSRADVLVDRLMRHFYVRLSAWTAIPTERGGGSTRSGEGHSGAAQLTTSRSEATDSSAKSSERSKRQRGEKGNGQDGNGQDSGDDDRKAKRPKGDSSLPDLCEEQRRLACPYYKRHPRKYQNWQSCRGPGWSSVHRLKEHLYRRHALRIHCNRCGYIVETDFLLREHQRADVPCEKTEIPRLDGFDKDQEKLLKGRKRNKGTETERWVDVYSILFPEDDQEFIPCPYYEASDLYHEMESSSSSSAAHGRYEDFLRNELPARIKRELCKEIERELDTSEERIKRKLPGIVRIVQKTLSEVFQSYESNPDDVTSQKVKSSTFQDPFPLPTELDYQEQTRWDLLATDEELVGLLGDDWVDTCGELPAFPMWTPESSERSLDG